MKFEYVVVDIDPLSSRAECQATLNWHGVSGWELVGIKASGTDNSRTTLYFKRPLVDTQE
jgi:hypothetical protein